MICAEEVDTLGGLVVALAGRIPNRGEAIRDPLSRIEFRIIESSARRIARLKLIGLTNDDETAKEGAKETRKEKSGTRT